MTSLFSGATIYPISTMTITWKNPGGHSLYNAYASIILAAPLTQAVTSASIGQFAINTDYYTINGSQVSVKETSKSGFDTQPYTVLSSLNALGVNNLGFVTFTGTSGIISGDGSATNPLVTDLINSDQMSDLFNMSKNQPSADLLITFSQPTVPNPKTSTYNPGFVIYNNPITVPPSITTSNASDYQIYPLNSITWNWTAGQLAGILTINFSQSTGSTAGSTITIASGTSIWIYNPNFTLGPPETTTLTMHGRQIVLTTSPKTKSSTKTPGFNTAFANARSGAIMNFDIPSGTLTGTTGSNGSLVFDYPITYNNSGPYYYPDAFGKTSSVKTINEYNFTLTSGSGNSQSYLIIGPSLTPNNDSGGGSTPNGGGSSTSSNGGGDTPNPTPNYVPYIVAGIIAIIALFTICYILYKIAGSSKKNTHTNKNKSHNNDSTNTNIDNNSKKED
jgi:hypothetical protein